MATLGEGEASSPVGTPSGHISDPAGDRGPAPAPAIVLALHCMGPLLNTNFVFNGERSMNCKVFNYPLDEVVLMYCYDFNGIGPSWTMTLASMT